MIRGYDSRKGGQLVATRSRLRPKNQITLPADVVAALSVQEGDEVEFVLLQDGVYLRGRRSIPTDQAWFWTPEWQAMEREADLAIEAGDVTRHGSTETFLASLD
jgi:antitoxin PrlF